MNNTELTLDQLQIINGGRVTLWGDVHTFLKPKIGTTSGPGGTSFPVALDGGVSHGPDGKVGGTSGPGGTSFPVAKIAGSADPGGDDI